MPLELPVKVRGVALFGDENMRRAETGKVSRYQHVVRLFCGCVFISVVGALAPKRQRFEGQF